MLYRTDYFGFVYLWRDQRSKRFYIGSHYGSTTDSYIASSKWLKAAYKKRPQDFKRRIIQYLKVNDKKLLLQMEQAWLNLIKPHELSTSANVIAGTHRYYNMKAHAAGGNGSANKGKTRVSWTKGATKEMIDLRRRGLFCLLSCDRPKPKKGNGITPKPKVVRKPRVKRLDTERLCEMCSASFMSKRNRFCNRRCANQNNSQNTDHAANGRAGVEKLRKTITGRKRVYRNDGTWTWGKESAGPSCCSVDPIQHLRS